MKVKRCSLESRECVWLKRLKRLTCRSLLKTSSFLWKPRTAEISSHTVLFLAFSLRFPSLRWDVISAKNATASVFSPFSMNSMNFFAFALFRSNRNTCSSFPKYSRTLLLLSHLTLLCRSKSSKVALTSVRIVHSKRCCSEDDALKTFMRLITVAMISEFTSLRLAQRTDWWILHWKDIRPGWWWESSLSLSLSIMAGAPAVAIDTTFFKSIPLSFSIPIIAS